MCITYRKDFHKLNNLYESDLEQLTFKDCFWYHYKFQNDQNSLLENLKMAGAPGCSMDQGVEVRKSKKSIVCSLVRFRNRTERGVDIIWLNYEGARVKYKTLQAYEFVDVNTYVGHPWIFLDVESGERLVVDLKSVYEPTTGWVPSQWPMKPVRKVVNITIPIYSLKDSCIRFFKKHLPKNNINKLDLPTSLLQEMYEKYDTPAIASGLRSTAKVIPPSDQQGTN